MTDALPLVVALILGLVLGAALALLAVRANNPEPSSLAAERAAVEAMVRPLQDTLARVSDDLARAERERAAAQAALTEQVRHTALGTEAVRDQTSRLVTALRRSEVRGRWGEVTLRRLVESAGLLEHVHFEEQASSRDDDGRSLRPDLVVHLADDRHVVVDAKVALSASLEAADAPDDATARLLLSRHAAEVAAHVDRLAAKEYWRLLDSPEFVVLFLPAESLLSSALEARPDLLEYAFARDVVIATPTTLLALLRTVAHTWRQEAAARNAAQVAALARDLHGRLATFAGHLTRLGGALDSTVGHYNAAVGSLESRVLVTARTLSALGVVEAGADDPDAGLPAPRAVASRSRPLTAAELSDPGGPVSGDLSVPWSDSPGAVTYRGGP
jgi:DNA recombination protein RmuC